MAVGPSWDSLRVALEHLRRLRGYDIMSQPCDVLVYRDGNDAVAKDCRTGQVIARSSDHAYVIQRAVESAVSVVYIAAGDYTLETYDVLSGSINAAIRIRSPVTIVGAGAEKTRLVLGSNVPATVVGVDNVNDVVVSSLSIDGNKVNNVDSGIDGNQAGILLLTGGYRAVIRDVVVRNCVREGIYLGAVQNQVHVENVTVENNGRHGLVLDKTIYSDVINVRALSNGLAGIYVSTGAIGDFQTNIIGGFFYNNSIGIHVLNARHVRIIGAKLFRNGVTGGVGDGALIQSSEDVEAAGVHAVENNRNGVYIISSTRSRVVGGVFRNNRYDGTNPQGSGVRLYDATDNAIVGVVAYDDRTTKAQQYGVEEAGASDYNVIASSILRGNALGGYVTVGLNTIVVNVIA